MKTTYGIARGRRRGFLGALAALVAVAALPLRALAGLARPDVAFQAVRIDDFFAALGGVPADSTDILLETPTIAENGAVVPVTVTSNIPGTTRIMIAVEKNPNPLSAVFDIPEGTLAFVDTRVKMAQTCLVYAVVEAGGKFYRAAKETKVTLGGCGG